MKAKPYELIVAVILSIWLFWPQNGNGYYNALSMFFSTFGLYSFGDVSSMFTTWAIFGFLLNMLPLFLFQAIVGIDFYRFFCVSSIYTFSRISNKKKWYKRQIAWIFLRSFLFIAVYSFCAMVINLMIGNLTVDVLGCWLLGYQIFTWSIWNFIMTMLVNFIALKFGSSIGYSVVIFVQLLFAGSLLLLHKITENDGTSLGKFARINPLSALMPGWQSARFLKIEGYPALQGVYAFDSIVFILIICAVVYIAGKYYTLHRDIILSNAEVQGV